MSGSELPASAGSEISWSEINDAVRRMMLTDKGKRRAANLISKIAHELAENDGCEDLANSGIAVQRYIVEAWENRWLRDRPGESQNSVDQQPPLRAHYA